MTNPSPRQLGRRAVLASGVALATAPAFAQPAPDEARRRDLLRFIRMRGALDDRLVIGYLSGRYDGLVDGELTPLFGLHAATFSRYRAKGDGFEAVSFEQAYFTDLSTRQVLDRWTNPYTGETVEPPVTRSAPSKLFIGPDLRFHPDKPAPPTFKLDFAAQGPEIIGDEIVFLDKAYASSTPPAPAPRFYYEETTTLTARLTDVDQRSTPTVPCQTSFTAIVSWRPWLKMGSHPGCMLGLGHGRYGAALESLPKPWLEATARLRPELLSHPEAVMEATWRA